MTGIAAPAPCPPHLSIGITGHRMTNPALAANLASVEAALARLFDHIDGLLEEFPRKVNPVHFYSLMVDGVDQLTARMALERDWQLVAPLPFGEALNLAINARPASAGDARALLEGKSVADPEVQERAEGIRTTTAQAHVFALADRDKEITELFLSSLARPEDFDRVRALETQVSDQVALAGRVMIERCDLLVAVWDGKVSNLRGGTGHTIRRALESGAPVLVVDTGNPDEWTILTRPEELTATRAHDAERLDAVLEASLGQVALGEAALHREEWPPGSSALWSFYRRIETVFGADSNRFRSLSTRYEAPGEIVAGSAAAFLAEARSLPGRDERQIDAIEQNILPQFAWSDGISSWLSDAYRSGMCYNFVLAALAVVIGAAYLPGDLSEHKWIFASIELLLLVLIVTITGIGGRRNWHMRWFETRRVAEYLRHGPILILLGVARPTGRWPRGKGDNWPERFARHCLRSAGLPGISIDRTYLRAALAALIEPHAAAQRSYHLAKAERLHKVHHRLDALAETLFTLAIVAVSAYLLLKLGSLSGIVPEAWPHDTSKLFTFLGIAFPTLGASVAGIRFFGDFERFASISQVTAEKLQAVCERIELLQAGPPSAVTYASVSELAHAIDEIVVNEIENWQAVFGGKHLSLPA